MPPPPARLQVLALCVKLGLVMCGDEGLCVVVIFVNSMLHFLIR